MTIPGKLRTTAMGVMPHTDVDRALSLALSLDVPYWPQLPKVSYREDMYVQASSGFPGVIVDEDERRLSFSMDRFMTELDRFLEDLETPEHVDLSRDDSVVYHRFLELELAERVAIRGQVEGPVSLGFNITDQDDRPIIFDDTVRPLMNEFLAKRANAQLRRLKERNANAFMFIDEPGLQFIFSAMSGYGDIAARRDLEEFFAAIERPRGVHLCGNPDWDFLLSLDLDILSLDIYTNGEVFPTYHRAVRAFLERGGVLVWGIVPTNVEPFGQETPDSLVQRLNEVWRHLERHGVDRNMLLEQSLLSPATCCLINPDGARTVEAAFSVTTEVSRRLKLQYGLTKDAEHPATGGSA